MPPFADVADVEGIWRTLTDEESQLAAAWLLEASQQIRDEVPDVDGLDVDERITAGSLSPDTVRSVAARMVRRVLMNPEGIRQRSHTLDDFQETVTIDSALSSSEMHITPREMNRLTGLRGRRRAFEIDTRPDPAQFVSSTVRCSPWDQIP